MITIDGTIPNGNLAEIYQNVDIKFAMAKHIGDNKYRVLHPFAKCRDFFTDLLVSARYKKDLPTIYGMTSQGKTDPIELNSLIFVLKVDPGAKDRFLKGMTLLQEFEERCGMRASTIEPIHLKDNMLLLKASRRWMVSSGILSLYTHLLRTIYGHTVLTGGEEVSVPFNTLEKFLETVALGVHTEAKTQQQINAQFNLELLMTNAVKLAKNSKRVLDGFDAGSMHNLHDTGGVNSMCSISAGGFSEQCASSLQAQRSHGDLVKRYKSLAA